MGRCSKRRAMNGKWAPGVGRNMYTTGLINNQCDKPRYLFLSVDEINNNVNDHYASVASINTLLPSPNILTMFDISQPKVKIVLEDLFDFIPKPYSGHLLMLKN